MSAGKKNTVTKLRVVFFREKEDLMEEIEKLDKTEKTIKKLKEQIEDMTIQMENGEQNTQALQNKIQQLENDNTKYKVLFFWIFLFGFCCFKTKKIIKTWLTQTISLKR